jgi:hypothetical protein
VPVFSLLACLPSLAMLRRELREAGPDRAGSTLADHPRRGGGAPHPRHPARPARLLAPIAGWKRCDLPQDAPPVDEAEVARMSAREDKLTQNHMGSVVLVKPGMLRAIVIRAGLRGLGLLLRVRPVPAPATLPACAPSTSHTGR